MFRSRDNQMIRLATQMLRLASQSKTSSSDYTDEFRNKSLVLSLKTPLSASLAKYGLNVFFKQENITSTPSLEIRGEFFMADIYADSEEEVVSVGVADPYTRRSVYLELPFPEGTLEKAKTAEKIKKFLLNKLKYVTKYYEEYDDSED